MGKKNFGQMGTIMEYYVGEEIEKLQKIIDKPGQRSRYQTIEDV